MSSSQKIQAFIRDKGPRFFAIIGLLSSDAEGERANAAALATRMLKEAGLTWGELSGTFGSSSPGSYGSGSRQETVLRGLWEQAKLRAEAAEKQVRHLQQSQREQQHLILKLQAEIARLRRPEPPPRDYSRGEEWAEQKQAGTKPKYKTFNVRLNELADQLEDALEMNDWEQGFVTSIRSRSFLTDKQKAKFEALLKQANIDYEDDLE